MRGNGTEYPRQSFNYMLLVGAFGSVLACIPPRWIFLAAVVSKVRHAMPCPKFMYVYICMYVCMYIHTYLCMIVCICMSVCVCVCVCVYGCVFLCVCGDGCLDAEG
jgi:hypothetical protein